MRCPECTSEIELCEKTQCSQAPHWTCSSFFGCGFSMPATQKEIQDFRWKGITRADSNETNTR